MSTENEIHLPHAEQTDDASRRTPEITAPSHNKKSTLLRMLPLLTITENSGTTKPSLVDEILISDNDSSVYPSWQFILDYLWYPFTDNNDCSLVGSVHGDSVVFQAKHSR